MLSRDTWATLWVMVMLAAIGAGVAMIIAGIGFNLADAHRGDVWVRNGWIGIIAGSIGLVVGIIILILLHIFRTKDEPPSWFIRSWRLVRRVRVRIGLNPIAGAEE